jgi:peptidoglycan/LPS O-acetylase OafA/YrhL
MPQLDALQALAVLAVMVHHFLPVDRYIPTDYVTLGFHYDERLRTRLPSLMKWFLIAGLGIMTLTTLLYIYNIGYRILHTLLCLGISLLFVVLIEKAARGFKGKAKTVMENPVVLYIGKISYGLYVYHNFMLAIVLYYLAKIMAVPDYRLVAVLSFVGTFATAILSWHLIERPIAQLKNKFSFSARKTGLPRESDVVSEA